MHGSNRQLVNEKVIINKHNNPPVVSFTRGNERKKQYENQSIK